MHFGYWEPPDVCKRMWSVNIAVSTTGEDQTMDGHSRWPLEELGLLLTGIGDTSK